MPGQRRTLILWGLVLLVISGSCQPIDTSDSTPDTRPVPPTPTSPPPTATTTAPPTPQPILPAVILGPEAKDFPPNYNPLTGQQAADPYLLDLPALLVSISNFPPVARPQAGLSFAPYVFEFSITEGATRFLAAFYGEFPYPETPPIGDCETRAEPFVQTDTVIGNLVWLDSNHNGLQDPGERGIGGVCVHLYDSNDNLLDKTTSDSNGFYGFNVEKGRSYSLVFITPPGIDFTIAGVGTDDQDSDANPGSGKTELIPVKDDNRDWDAGMYLDGRIPTSTPDLKHDPKPQVGPVRSGRLLYAHIGNFFQDSCLIYAFASKEILVEIPKCSFVSHEDAGGGSMLDISRMEAIARENGKVHRDFNYSGNLYDQAPPTGGFPADQLSVYFAYLSQSGWSYDPLSQSYLRYTDDAEEETAGQLHPDTDRLNGRQLHFENIIVIMADHEVISPTNLEIHLDQGELENAYLFRDGRMYEIRWSTRSTTYEKETGFRQPIRFINRDGSPAALKPGHTWVIIVTPWSTIAEQATGVWQVRYFGPEGESR